MFNHNEMNSFKIVVVGNERAGKSALIRRIVGEEFYSNYRCTIGVDFFRFQRESIAFHIWDIGGYEKFGSMLKIYYRDTSAFIYVLDSTKEAEENKKIFQEFNTGITLKGSTSGCLQLIVFNKSDDKGSKLSKDYISEFDIFNIPTIICSAKTNEGSDEVKDKCFNYFNESIPIKKPEEESLVSDIESYSKILNKKHSQIAKNKSIALEAIAKVCRDGGMGQRQGQANREESLSREQIAKIKEIIRDQKEIISQHRHWSVFNCFFYLIGSINPTVLERRVTSHGRVTELDNYLNTRACKQFCVSAVSGEPTLEFDSESIHSGSPIM
ncbi:Rab family GTPase [Rickettsiella endosymbiont of Dermanyssus gallinae]|uniref:Rab family GTPase n=1 Tax=Rickettsiella endosymbiont of Dermanyssus gallinae TaxID=2856608 RepID=UPI001C531BD9|nr:Rab family GTPase [Rickettsiella endosymbiont of Dermanyssus gallinae]